MSESTREIIRPMAVLFLVAAVAAMLLGFVYEVTKEPIAQQEAKQLKLSMQAVMPSATAFEELEGVAEGNITAVYQSDTDGFVLAVNTLGYGGNISLLVGVNADGTTSGVRILSHSETPGLGARSTEAKFYEQFVGMTSPVAVTKDGGQVEAITSATVTSRAVSNGVEEALEWVAQKGGAY